LYSKPDILVNDKQSDRW